MASDDGREVIVATYPARWYRRLLTGVCVVVVALVAVVEALVVASVALGDAASRASLVGIAVVAVPLVAAVVTLVAVRMASDGAVLRWMMLPLVRWSSNGLPGNAVAFVGVGPRGIRSNVGFAFRAVTIPWSHVVQAVGFADLASVRGGLNRVGVRLWLDGEAHDVTRYEALASQPPFTHEISVLVTHDAAEPRAALERALGRFAPDGPPPASQVIPEPHPDNR